MFKQVLLILALVCCGPAYAAGIYKWVDERGNTQYSATPPPYGTTYENLSTSSRPNQDSEAAGETSSVTGEEPNKAASALGEKQETLDHKEQWAENCRIAQTNAAKLEGDRDIVQTGADGKKFLLEGEQRQDALRQAHKDIEYYCNP
jgi:hypothetical protein